MSDIDYANYSKNILSTQQIIYDIMEVTGCLLVIKWVFPALIDLIGLA